MKCPHCDVSIDEHEASRCLDAWVAEAVMGEKMKWRSGLVSKYSTDIAAAWEVVEKLNNGGHVVKIANDLVAWSVVFIHVSDLENPCVASWKASLPVQVCCAALKAVHETQTA